MTPLAHTAFKYSQIGLTLSEANTAVRYIVEIMCIDSFICMLHTHLLPHELIFTIRRNETNAPLRFKLA